MAPKDQEATLKQFREELTKEGLLNENDCIGTDDATLLRFLRARQFNLKNAKVMWKNCYDWRKNAEGVGIDELYRRIDPFDYPERNHVFQFWPLFFHKTDKKGRPLNIHHFGRINVAELYKGISPERFWQAFLVNADSLTREVLPATAVAAGKPIDGTFVIVDLKGFGTGQFWQMKSLARGAFQVSQDYFPETMAQLAIVNAPSSFTAIWSVMRPWLAKETAAKVSVLGANYQKALLELVDAENLPETLGGTCTCAECTNITPDGGEGGVAEMGRCAFSSAGPWMVGRAERRAAWLAGERKCIALEPGELEKFAAAEKRATQPEADEKAVEARPPLIMEDSHGNEERFEDAKSSLGEASAEESSEDVSPGPSTPGVESVQEQLGEVQIKSDNDESPARQLSHTEAAAVMEQKHPETRLVENGDLHAN
ncbi:Sec14-like phosphatidylinositol transfer family protein [Phanerochaete sordida]|uniref:Sec14-like phosphatidylinositol transfer family protein n=1 Tax=Phanerochaete sordida TaxID=48140 RepID=A0A9P3GLY3_9APHY|nr:Sec14-like phosphatidylinositol transfer family protein [Phanerochaete sordida]